MKTYIKMGVIGAISGFIVAASVFFITQAHASSPSEKEDTQLEQLVSQNNACRVIVIRVRTGMTRLIFSNKEEAQKAIDLMWKQAHEQATGASNSFEFLSPNCDLDVESGK